MTADVAVETTNEVGGIVDWKPRDVLEAKEDAAELADCNDSEVMEVVTI
jgi:hypothetical protein